MEHHSGAHVYLIGTSHHLLESAIEVKKVIRQVQPSVVVLEVDEKNWKYFNGKG